MTKKNKTTLLWLMDAISQPCGDECMRWPFSTGKNGYGQTFKDGKVRTAHSVVCEITHGPRPKNNEAAHSCGNRWCFNPNHIRWKSQSENNREKYLHGTMPLGENSKASRLKEWQVKEIRRSYQSGGKLFREIAKEYGTADGTIQAIVHRRTWRHI